MTSIAPRKFPHDLEAETAVIGSCLIDPDRVAELDLEESHFYILRNGIIFKAMQTIVRSGMALDYATLISHLDAHKQLDFVGGSGYVAGAIDRTPTSFHVHDYAAIVKDRAARRALIALAGQIAGDCYNESTDLNACRSEWLAELVATVNVRGRAEPISGTALALARDIETAAANPREIYGIPTGFCDFDHITKGLHPGESLLLAGQPGMGKSLFAGQSAFQMAESGAPGAIYAMEMQATAMLRRQVSGLTKITTSRIRGGTVADGDLQALYATIGYYGQLPLFISDSTHWNTTTLRADIARLKASAGIQWVIVDHISLLTDQGSDPNERDKVISQALHNIAKDFQIAVWGIHTMNKAGIKAGANPTMADVSGSGKFLYDADVICFLTEHLPQNGEGKRDNLRTITFTKYREDDADRYMHIMKPSVADERGKRRGLPRFENYAEETL